MECEHRGPFHLGISEEACENAGGKWYRTPCVTLQECIDDRPPRFELDAPQADSCQDNLKQLNVAYVSAPMSHDEFTYDSDENGSFKFCQSLPDYPLQIGMEVEEWGGIPQVRTVRVQLEGTNFLQLAEVQVFDNANENMALNKPATQSSLYSALYPASLAVNGNLNDSSITLHEARKYSFSCKYTIFCSACLQALSPLPFTSVKVLGGKLICKRMCK